MHMPLVNVTIFLYCQVTSAPELRWFLHYALLGKWRYAAHFTTTTHLVSRSHRYSCMILVVIFIIASSWAFMILQHLSLILVVLSQQTLILSRIFWISNNLYRHLPDLLEDTCLVGMHPHTTQHESTVYRNLLLTYQLIVYTSAWIPASSVGLVQYWYTCCNNLTIVAAPPVFLYCATI